MLCATPRTGSYLLCEGLQHTGMAGVPNEYLSVGFEKYWRPRWGVKTYDEYLARVTKTGSTPNGVFGVKVHPVQFAYFGRQASGKSTTSPTERRELFERSFPGARYVWMRRRDKLLQGISYARALQSRVWWNAEKPPSPYDPPRPDAVRFDRALLERCVTQMHVEEHVWSDYFEANGIEPLQVDYEDLVQDPLAAVRDVVAHLDLKLPDDFSLPPTKFKRQADSTTETWRLQLTDAVVAEPAIRLVDPPAARPAGAPPAKKQSRGTKAAAPATGAPAAEQNVVVRESSDAAAAEPSDQSKEPPIRLEDVLASRRWWRGTTPISYVRAENVFIPSVYEAMADQFRSMHTEGQMQRNLPGYDASAVPITSTNVRAFGVLASRAWHDLWSELFGANCTGELNITLHHHAKGSASGSPHNDLNPGFFLEDHRNEEGIIISDPQFCNYRSGWTYSGTPPVERMRAVALLFYLANNEHYGVGWGGETGFYRTGSDLVNRPVTAVPAINNSLVAFECTPFSYHSFISNTRDERNCVAMWLHRAKDDVVQRWGERTIVGW